MKIAVMQPYFFPYIGYWQLIYAVDKFIIYDDVNYIKGGWINRNRILINGKPAFITAPVHKASSNKRICDMTLQQSTLWRPKLIKMLSVTYRRSPYFNIVFPIIENLINKEVINLSEYLSYQIQTIAALINIKTVIVMTSRKYQNNYLSGQARILDICKCESATVYINPQGGRKLYDTESFRESGLDLRFLITRPVKYKQRTIDFIPYLSIIDGLMEIGPTKIKNHLTEFDLSDMSDNRIV